MVRWPLVQPVFDVLHHIGDQCGQVLIRLAVEHRRSRPPGRHQTPRTELRQVLGHRWRRTVQLFRDLPHRQLGTLQHRENRQPGRVGQQPQHPYRLLEVGQRRNSPSRSHARHDRTPTPTTEHLDNLPDGTYRGPSLLTGSEKHLGPTVEGRWPDDTWCPRVTAPQARARTAGHRVRPRHRPAHHPDGHGRLPRSQSSRRPAALTARFLSTG